MEKFIIKFTHGGYIITPAVDKRENGVYWNNGTITCYSTNSTIKIIEKINDEH
jgi:hypothetical protein